jgi:hypothetical protein
VGHGIATVDALCGRDMAATVARLNVERAREDVRRFVKVAEVGSIDLWSRESLQNQNRKLTGYFQSRT